MNAVLKVLNRIPLIGRLARDEAYGPVMVIFLLLAVIVLAVATAVFLFGYPALICAALAATATMLAIIIRITLG